MTEGVAPIQLRTSPHIRQAVTTDVIMLNVVYALLPVVAFAVFAFGISALALVLVATASAVLTEHLVQKLAGKKTTINDYSAVITGILLALTLPPGFPLWMAAVGGIVSIALGKALFGGLGFNVFNPALVARAFLQAAFPVAITTWSPAFITTRFTQFIPSSLAWPFLSADADAFAAYVKNAAIDGWTGATPLSRMKFEGQFEPVASLFSGTVAGSAGETAAWLILLCGVYLAVRKMLDWRIPVGMLGSVVVFSLVFYLLDGTKYPNPFFMLFSGGLMLGAVFMATDMVTCPTTPLGVWIYALLLGFLTVLIRLKGGLPEGVMYAILLGNAVTPLINMYTQPRIYGAKKVTAPS